MFETPFTVVGNVITDVVARRAGESNLATFRMASNSRKKTDDGWEPGNSLFITVTCWGKLVTGVGAALYKGAPVIVVGDVFTSEYDDKDGVRRSSLELRATAVGPDLSRAIVRFEQQPKPAGPAAEDPEPDPVADVDESEEGVNLAVSA